MIGKTISAIAEADGKLGFSSEFFAELLLDAVR